MGERALLAMVDDTGDALALFASMQRDPLEGQVDVVPGAQSVLVRFCEPVRPSWVESLSRRYGPALGPQPRGEEVTIDVRYLGPDMHEVARLTGRSPEAVVKAHTGAEWRVAFCGFSPGFAYLVGGEAWLTVPRRDTPRTRVPPGSVGLAGEYSGIYPSATPGGWQLIGRTDAALWDARRTPPALLRPGVTVRFRAIRDAAVTASATSSGREAAREGATATGAQRSSTQGSSTQGSSAQDSGAQDSGAERERSAEPAASLTVVRPGVLCTVQDLGRPGWATMGVGPSGAADRGAAGRANRIVGNDAGAGVLEILLGGAAFRVGCATVLSVTGAPVDVRILAGSGDGDGDSGSHGRDRSDTDLPDPMNRPIPVAPGTRIRLGRPARGLRSYLAVRGGIDTSQELGSRSSDLLGGIGPTPLRAGDVLPIGENHRGIPHPDPWPALPDPLELDLLPGPQLDWFEPGSLERIAGMPWVVSPESNRVAVRLLPSPDRQRPDRRHETPDRQQPASTGGHRLPGESFGPRRLVTAELPVQGLVRGAVQVPPSGELVAFLADHPVTGGYPVIATLTDVAADLAAQARPGATVRLRAHPDGS